MRNKLIEPGRVAAMAVLFTVLMIVYLVFLYKLQIVEGEIYYNRSSELTSTERTVTAARGNILDRYGRGLLRKRERAKISRDV